MIVAQRVYDNFMETVQKVIKRPRKQNDVCLLVRNIFIYNAELPERVSTCNVSLTFFKAFVQLLFRGEWFLF